LKHHIKYTSRTHCEIHDKCNSDCTKDFTRVVRIKDHESNLGEFDVIYCKRCSLGFTNPYPTEETTGFLYDEKTSGDFDLANGSFVDKIKDSLSQYHIKKITAGIQVRKVLDYSTGNGRFAIAASIAHKGADIVAVDYQDSPPPLLRNQKKISYLTLAEHSENHTVYDFIILRHVLEHTHHPGKLITELASRLSSKGILYIEVPNLNSGCAKVFGKYYKGYYVPRHLFHYTKKSLSQLIKNAGLEADLYTNEMPLMGNTLSILFRLNKISPLVQLLGIAMHPLQLCIELLYRSSTCLNATCFHIRTEQENPRP